LRQKQVSLEEEKRLEEEINRRLSSVDQILSKALKVIKIETPPNEEIKRASKSVDEGFRIDLHRIYKDHEAHLTKGERMLKEAKRGFRV
jgi:hypothetical protein